MAEIFGGTGASPRAVPCYHPAPMVGSEPPAGGQKKPSPILGVDLGMTSAVAALVSSGGETPQVVPLEKGLTAMAAIVSFPAGRSPIIGRAARDLVTTAPAETVTGVKRLLGRKLDSQAVRELSTRVGYQLGAGADGDAVILAGGRQLTPPEVAGQILARVAQLATEQLRVEISRCVLAVPAYFNNVQKAAIKEAARLAGLEVVKLVHEPTAVALAYGYNRSGDSRVLILDMGGIRLDVSLMEITGNVFDVVATGGDPYLGGANLDARIAEWILANIKKKFGQDLAQEPRLLMKVRTAAEQAKRELSRFKAVDLQIPLEHVAKGQRAQIGQLRLKAEVVEKLAEELVSRVITVIRHVLKDRGLGPKDIDDILLVGGGTRLPLLRRRVAELFGKEPRSDLPPEEVIALGAALLADSIARGVGADDMVVKEPVGIALADGRYMRIIDRDSKLPITRRVMIPTVRDDQQCLELDLFQGAGEDIMDNEYLGTVVYRGIQPAKAGEAKVVVDLALDSSGLLLVTSPETGREPDKYEFRTKNVAGEPPPTPEPVFHVARGTAT